MFYLFLTGPCSSVLVRWRLFQSPIFWWNYYKINEKTHHLIGKQSNYWNQSLEFFLWNKFVLNRYKTCDFTVSNTGKQQFTANQSIYHLSDKDRSVSDDIDLWRSVWTRLYDGFYFGTVSESSWSSCEEG